MSLCQDVAHVAVRVSANKRASALVDIDRIAEMGTASSLPEPLRALLGSGLVNESGCLFVAALRATSPSFELDAFPDRTGAECFVNHVHVDDLIPGLARDDQLRHGVVLGIELCRIATPHSVRVIVSQGEDGAVVRLHVRRAGERWICDDLDRYVDERVIVIDS
jgi:hypothetical protein